MPWGELGALGMEPSFLLHPSPSGRASGVMWGLALGALLASAKLVGSTTQQPGKVHSAAAQGAVGALLQSRGGGVGGGGHGVPAPEHWGVCPADLNLSCYRCFKVTNKELCRPTQCSPTDRVCVSHTLLIFLRESLGCGEGAGRLGSEQRRGVRGRGGERGAIGGVWAP